MAGVRVAPSLASRLRRSATADRSRPPRVPEPADLSCLASLMGGRGDVLPSWGVGGGDSEPEEETPEVLRWRMGYWIHCDNRIFL